MAVEQKVVELVIDASGVERGADRTALAYDHMGARADAAAARAQASFDRQFQTISTKLPRSIHQVANAYDNLQAKLDPVFHAQLRAEREMTQSLAVINRAVLLGVTTEQEATRDIVRLKQQQIESINRVRDAQILANDTLRKHSAANDNGSQFRRQGLMYQGFDTFTSLSGGMNIGMVAAQQGPQVLQMYAGQGGINAALKDTGGLLASATRAAWPLALAAIAAGVAFKGMQSEIEKSTGKTVTFSDTALSALKIIGSDIYSYLGPSIESIGTTFDYVTGKLGSASVDIAELLMNSFRAAFEDIKFVWNSFPDIMEAAILGAVNRLIAGVNTMVQKSADAVNWLRDKVGMDPLTAPPVPDVRNRAAERLAAQVNDRNNRVEEIMADHPIRDWWKSITDRLAEDFQFERLPEVGPVPAQNPRRSLDADPAMDATANAGRNRIRELQQQIETMNMTAGAAAKLRYEQEQLNAAIDKHIELSPQQRSQITKDAAAVGAMTDKLSQMRLQQDAQFELDQIFRSDREGRIASQLRGSGLDVDLDGQNAAMLRTIELLKEQKAAWEDIRDVGKDAVDQIVDSATGGFENIGDVFDGIAKDVLKQFTTLGVANPLKNAIFGGELPTMDTVGGIGGILKALTGGSNPALDAASRSVGAMSVTAASVVVNGGAGSAVSSLAGQAANQNDPLASALSNDPASDGSGDKLAWNFWKSKGLSDHQVAGVLGNIKAESAFNPAAVGDGGAAKGLYQWNDRGPSMIGAVGADWKNNPLAQHEFAYKELMGPENRAWKALLASQDTKGATAAFAGFERPSGFSWDNPEAAHNFVGRLNGANESLAKFGGTTNAATQGLGTLGNGLGQVGNALAQGGAAAPSGGGGGGLFGWLGNLFSGGVSPTSSSWAANTTYGNFLSGVPGFADGTDSAPGGYAWIGERGKELMRVPRGAEIIPAHRTAAAIAPSVPSVSFKSTVINNSSSRVEERETTDENGGRGVEYVISDRVASAMGKRGGSADRMLKARGASMPRTRR